MQQNTSLRSRSQAADFLGIKPQTLAVWAATKRYNLPYVKVGRRAMYRTQDLDAFVMSNRFGNEIDVVRTGASHD